MTKAIDVFTVSLKQGFPLDPTLAKAVIELQKLNLFKENQAKELSEKGFLMTCFSEAELEKLYCDNAQLLVAVLQDKSSAQDLVGFLLLTNLKPLYDQMNAASEKPTFKEISPSLYIYQLAVHPKLTRMGIAQALVKKAKELSNHIYVDVTSRPISNTAAQRLFSKELFIPIGEMIFENYRGYEGAAFEIALWSRDQSS